MHRLLLALLYRFLLYPAMRIYWRVFQPESFGVRIILRARGDGRILLVRHAYGRRMLWYPPGGGFRPSHEQAADAIRRETYEEVGLQARDVVFHGRAQDDSFGNLDTVHYFSGFADQLDVTPSAEIADHRWVTPADCAGMEDLSIHVHTGLRLMQSSGSAQ